MTDQFAKNVATLCSVIKKVEAENIDLKTEVKELASKLEAKTSDLDKLKDFTHSLEKDLSHDLDISKDKSKEERNSLDIFLEEYKKEIEGLKHSINNVEMNISRCYRMSQRDNEKLKEEILSLPCKASRVKEELLEKLKVSAVNNTGILQELKVVKKEVFIHRKENEYFHTQLRRLKEAQTPKD